MDILIGKLKILLTLVILCQVGMLAYQKQAPAQNTQPAFAGEWTMPAKSTLPAEMPLIAQDAVYQELSVLQNPALLEQKLRQNAQRMIANGRQAAYSQRIRLEY